MKIEIKVVRLDGTKHVRRLRTQTHIRRLTSSQVDEVLHQEAERVEQYFPGAEFRLVPLRNGSFNFVEIEPEVALSPVMKELQKVVSAPAWISNRSGSPVRRVRAVAQ